MTAITPKAAKALYLDGLETSLGRGGYALRAMRRVLPTLEAQCFAPGDEARVWVWSDLHFGHANIIGYTNRPFDDVDEMNEALWSNWHNTVPTGDTLVCVGDVAMAAGVNPSTWQRIRNAPGKRKILVVGNHDLRGATGLRTQGFDSTPSLLVSPGRPPIIWTHAPLATVPAGHVNIHGHFHEKNLSADSPHINVSVEQTDYRPLSMARLRRLALAILTGQAPSGETTLARIVALERLIRDESPE